MALIINDSFPGRWDIMDTANGTAYEINARYAAIKRWCIEMFGPQNEFWWWSDAGEYMNFVFRKEEYVTVFLMRWA